MKAEKSYNDGKINHAATKTYEQKDAVKPPNKTVATTDKEITEPVKTQTQTTEKKAEIPLKVVNETEENLEEFNATGDRVFKNSKGQITREGRFENGKLQDGKTYIYSSDGKLVKINIWEKGLIVKVINR